MTLKGLFKNHKNVLENDDGSGRDSKESQKTNPTRKLYAVCPKCKKNMLQAELLKNYGVCPACGYHYKISARQRIKYLVDAGTFEEHDRDLSPANILSFPGYDEKLKASAQSSSEREAVVCGIGEIGGYGCAVFAMAHNFMMGSMGTVVGEKITRLFEYASEKKLPVVGVTVSGGARMQEGILSLMQMAKISGALKRHSDGGNLYIAVLADPTSGGVTASFAMLGDVIIAEPEALICFAGPRVIEQTIRQKLPEGFQRAEYLYKAGFLDNIVVRGEQKEYITKLLRLHRARTGCK